MRIKAYWNTTRRIWSLLDLRGKLIGHRAYMQLENVSCRVSEAGRQRCLRTGKKVVHAFLIGDLIECEEDPVAYDRGVRYNPYKHEGFVMRDDESARMPTTCVSARFHGNGRVTIKE